MNQAGDQMNMESQTTKRKADELTRQIICSLMISIQSVNPMTSDDYTFVTKLNCLILLIKFCFPNDFLSQVRLMRKDGLTAMCIHGDTSSRKRGTGSLVTALASWWPQMLMPEVLTWMMSSLSSTMTTPTTVRTTSTGQVRSLLLSDFVHMMIKLGPDF